MAASPQVLISLADDILTLFIRPDDYLEGHCATLHIQLDIAAAADFRPGVKYQPVKAWACTAAAADGLPHCPQHWFSRFSCYALDGQPVTMAHSPQQLAAVLHLAQVKLCGADSKQELLLPASSVGAAATDQQRQQQQQQQRQVPAMNGHAAQQAAASDGDAAVQAGRQQLQKQEQPKQQQEQPKPVLHLSIPKLSVSNTAKNGCHSVMVMVDVASSGAFLHGPTYKVLYSWCCGKEAGTKAFCKQHTTARFNMLDRSLVVLGSVNSLPQLASNLGYSAVDLKSDQPNLLQILSEPSDALPPSRGNSSSGGGGDAAAAAAAAAAGGGGDAAGGSSRRPQRGVAGVRAGAATPTDSPPHPQQQQQSEVAGQKRSSAEAELPNPSNAKVAANGRSRSASSAAAAAKDGDAAVTQAALLRLKLSAADAAEQRQVLQQQLDALRDASNQEQQQQLEAQLQLVDQLCAADGLDVPLPVAQGSSNSVRTRCLGVTLQLSVGDVKELCDSSSYVRILQGRRCGHEGGSKRACKRHRVATFILETEQGEPLASLTHLEGLANRLKVSSAAMLELPGLSHLTDYEGLPATPTWHRAPDSSVLRVWRPQDARMLPGNWQQNPCCGLDVYVDRPKDVQQAVGSPVTVMSVVCCGNEAGAKATCRRHTTQGPLQLFSWTDSLAGVANLNTTPGGTAIHACSDLAQLAMWLGVGKVEVLDADSNEPLQYYLQLGIPAAIQLPLPGTHQQQQPYAAMAQPSLGALQPAAAMAAAAAAAAGVAAVHLEAGGSSNGQPGAAAGVWGECPAAAAAGTGNGVPLNGSLDTALAAAAAAGGLVPLNVFGNSRVEVSSAQAAVGDPPHQQQLPQQQVTIRVQGQPIGGHQGHPCRLLHVVLLLPDKSQYVRGQQYPVLFAHRCGNEAGNRSRCRQHSDAAVRILATDPTTVAAAAAAMQNVPSYTLSAAKPSLTHSACLAIIQESQLVGKVNSSRDLAAFLGAGAVHLLESLTGESLGDAAAWSPTNQTGTAAKVAASGRDAAAVAALAAVAAAGVPGVPSAQALLAALSARAGGLPTPLTKVECLELDVNAPAMTAAYVGTPTPVPAPAAGAGAGAGDVVMAEADANQQQQQQQMAVPAAAAANTTSLMAAVIQQQQQQQQQQQVVAGSVGTQPPGQMSKAVSAAAAAASTAPAAVLAAAAAARQQQAAAAAAVAGGAPGSGNAHAAVAAAAGPGSSGFATSAPRHLQQWAASFKPAGGPTS